VFNSGEMAYRIEKAIRAEAAAKNRAELTKAGRKKEKGTLCRVNFNFLKVRTGREAKVADRARSKERRG